MFGRVVVMPKDKVHQASAPYCKWRNIFMSCQALCKAALKSYVSTKVWREMSYPYFLTLHFIQCSPSERTTIADEKMQMPNGDQEVRRRGVSE